MFVARKHPKVPDFFETEHLLLRAPQPGDGKAVNDAIRESIDELRPWMHWARTAQSVAETETWVREAALRFRNHEDLPMLIFRKSDGLYVGGSGLHNIDWEVPCFETGYWIRTSLRGQGLITEAVHGITIFAFGELDGIRARNPLRRAQRAQRRCCPARRVHAGSTPAFQLARARWQPARYADLRALKRGPRTLEDDLLGHPQICLETV